MLILKSPPTYEPERRYIFGLLIGEFLGLEHQIRFEDRPDICVTNADGRELVIADVFFQTPREFWLTEASLPKQPLALWDVAATCLDVLACDGQLPVIHGTPVERSAPNQLHLMIDIFGSAFFMLSRYEEVVKSERDFYGRFPAAASLAFQEGFLDRPIVNEYLEILWSALKRLWPQLERKRRSFRVLPTHDIDEPFDFAFLPLYKVVRKLGGDLIKRKTMSWSRLLRCTQVRQGRSPDPFDTFSWIMDRSEENGVRSKFYLMAGGHTSLDPGYDLTNSTFCDRVREILARGHEVGFHPSYATSADKMLWNEELDRLRVHFPEIHVEGGRQHFLRFQVPETWRFWERAEMRYDSSMGFADRAGFRCGTCYSYSPFDLKERRKLRLKERPLIMMECAVIDPECMALGITEAALEHMQMLKQRCKMFNGDFVFLWHNSRLARVEEKMIAQALFSTDA